MPKSHDGRGPWHPGVKLGTSLVSGGVRRYLLELLLEASERSFRGILVACLAASVAIFVLDLALPAAVAPDLLYGLVLLGSAWAGRPAVTRGFAALNTLLIPLPHLLSPPPAPFWIAAAQHAFSLIVLWLVALLVLAILEALAALRQRGLALASALADKEMLLREVRHRTKNQLQMLAGLLELQAEAVVSAEGKAVLAQSADRVSAIGHLHELLYASMASGRIQLGVYLRRLVQGFREVCRNGSGRRVTFHLPEDGPDIEADRAMLCGLIVNELLTNAVKHAFPRGIAGDVGIEVQAADDRIRLRIWDSGRGLPAGLKVEDSRSVGLRLVTALAHRLQGHLVVENSSGTAFILTFPSTLDT